MDKFLSCLPNPVYRKSKEARISQGCTKLCFPGRGQLVPGTVGLLLRGQAVPAPFIRAFDLEVDAVLRVSEAQGESKLLASRLGAQWGKDPIAGVGARIKLIANSKNAAEGEEDRTLLKWFW